MFRSFLQLQNPLQTLHGVPICLHMKQNFHGLSVAVVSHAFNSFGSTHKSKTSSSLRSSTMQNGKLFGRCVCRISDNVCCSLSFVAPAHFKACIKMLFASICELFGRSCHAPLGLDELTVVRHLQTVSRKQQVLFDRTPVVHNLQSAWLLLFHCGSVRVNYFRLSAFAALGSLLSFMTKNCGHAGA